jgi:competence protein ComFC
LILSKRTWVRRLVQSAGQLLSSMKYECLSCKQKAQLIKGRLGLCNSCYLKIPWIQQVLCPVCGRFEFCPDCNRRQATHFSKSRSAVRYDDAMKELLARYKYRGDERIGLVIGAMLVHSFRLLQADQSLSRIPSTQQFITYVPLSERRMLERGFNQAEQMAREVGRAMHLPVVPLLQRTRHTDKQSFKSRGQRIEDMEHVFELDEGGIQQVLETSIDPAPLQIYLVDDVYTTGSTLNQCSRVLKERLKADVYGLIWAR